MVECIPRRPAHKLGKYRPHLRGAGRSARPGPGHPAADLRVPKHRRRISHSHGIATITYRVTPVPGM